MAAFEVLALDPTTPQIRAPGAADTYTFPRAVAMAVALPVASGGTGTSTPSLVAGANVTISGAWPNQTIAAAGGGGSSTLTISNKTAAYTVVAGDLGTIINCTANTFTVSLTAATTLGAGFNCWVWNTGASTVTIDPNGAETIDGVSLIALNQGEGIQIVCDGTNWITGDKKMMRGYAENLPSTSVRPSATVGGAIAIGRGAVSGNADSFAIGRNSTASSTGAYAIGYLTSATAQYGVALGSNSGGGGSQSITNSGAMALGGSYASGTDSFSAAATNNTSSYGATGPNSIAIGQLAKATTNAAIAMGYIANATGSGSVAIAGSGTGWGCDATAGSAFAIGDGAVSSIKGKFAFASGSSAVNKGVMQSGMYILSLQTTNATPSTLNSYNYAASDATNQVGLNTYTAFAFSGIVVARQQGAAGTQSAAWKIEGLIRKEAANITTTLVASTVTVISNVPGWTLALSADTTNGALAITATGALATNIRWVATVQTSEVIYA